MGLRFRKSVKIAPGVRLNVGKKSTGVSIGNRGGGFSINSKTGVRARASIPGTGISYNQKLGGSSGKAKNSSKKPITMRWWYFAIALFLLIGGIGNIGESIGAALLGISIFAVMIFFTVFMYRRRTSSANNELIQQHVINCRRIITESYHILQDTENIDTFLSRYKVMMDAVAEAGEIAGMDNPCMGDGVTPRQALETMQQGMPQMLNPCIEKYMRKKTLHICELTRGRMAKALAVDAIIDEYADRMPAESIEYWRELAQKLVGKIKAMNEAEKSI